MLRNPEEFIGFPPAQFDGTFHWDYLLPAFAGTTIEPMDIDAVVERRGKILMVETKEGIMPVPDGQIITLERFLVIGNGMVHIMVIYGKTAETVVGLDEWSLSENRIVKTGIRKCHYDYVLRRVSKWFRWANGEF